MGKTTTLEVVQCEMSTGNGPMAMLSGSEGNRKTSVALAMRHRQLYVQL